MIFEPTKFNKITYSISLNWNQHYQNNGGIPVSHAHYKIFLLALVILKSPAMLENSDGIER